uniref:Uncharacterized protein n=1 Tax=Anopheles atroparvus TaxID=41427 RepID=A0AAG5DNC4_ANOAO
MDNDYTICMRFGSRGHFFLSSKRKEIIPCVCCLMGGVRCGLLGKLCNGAGVVFRVWI